MDPNRNYAEDGDPSWYQPGERYTRTGWSPASGGAAPDRDEPRYQVPEPRAHDRAGTPTGDPLAGPLYGDRAAEGSGRSATGDPSRAEPAPSPGGPGTDPRNAGRTQVIGSAPDAYGAGHPDFYGAGRPDTYGGPPVYGAPAGARPDAARDGSAPGNDDSAHHHTQPLDRSALRRPEPVAERQGNVYKTRRPAAATAIIVVVAVCELIAFRVFAAGLFGGPLETAGTVSGMFLLSGLPLTGIGLYSLASGGAAPGAGPQPWLRTPLAYLWVGLALLVAAGAAA